MAHLDFLKSKGPVMVIARLHFLLLSSVPRPKSILARITAKRWLVDKRSSHSISTSLMKQLLWKSRLGLRNPNSEVERDVFKCLLAQEGGCAIKRLWFFAKPG